MKKKVLLGLATLMLAVFTTWSASVNSNKGLNDISLANVEALAKGEIIVFCAEDYESLCVVDVENFDDFTVTFIFFGVYLFHIVL